MWSTYWWGIEDENSDMCGEEFFTALKDATKEQHRAYAKEIFPGENPVCYGFVTEEEADRMGLDTY